MHTVAAAIAALAGLATALINLFVALTRHGDRGEAGRTKAPKGSVSADDGAIR
jgi:hypothetical protein